MTRSPSWEHLAPFRQYMQDELQSEERPNSNEEQPATPHSTPAGESESTTAEATPARPPAATASSYRDIIAERLARKAGGGDGAAHSPMAHSSDVELTQRTASTPENQAESSTDDRAGSSDSEVKTAQPEISLKTRTASEVPAGGSATEVRTDAGISSRERARIRQQERAALRRQGARAADAFSNREEETAVLETPSADQESGQSVEEAASAQERKDIIAERMARRGGDREQRRPERSREEGRGREDGRNREEGRGREESRRREEPRRGGSRREETPRELPAKPQTEVPSGLTLRSAQSTPRVIEEPRREAGAQRSPSDRTSSDRRASRPESASRPEAGARPETGARPGSDAAHSLAAKLGISVVVPLFNEQDSLRELTAALKQQLMRLAGPKYEILYVNDGSTDRSGEILQDILATSSRVTVISFRRNLGKSAALAAGFAEAQYGIVITLDADLQDDPQEFVNLIAKLAEGYDLVSGWKKQRHDPVSKTGPSKFFNWVTGMFSGIKLHDFNCGLKAYRKEVTESLQVYGEMHRYLPALAYWQGFRVTEIPVTHHPRKFGKSKFGSSRFFKGFLDLLSIVFTNRYGKRPLHLFGTIGTLMAIAGFIIDIYLTVEWALGLTSLSNRPILLLGLLLILVGVQLISIGLLGEMIVKNAASKATLNYQKEKGKPSAEARERRASRMSARSGGPRPPRPGGSRPERRGPSRRPV